MCGIWDWQSTIVKDLNDSQDPKHTLFCRENAFVAIYAIFSDNKRALLARFGGGGRRKGTKGPFFTVSFIAGLPLCCLPGWLTFSTEWRRPPLFRLPIQPRPLLPLDLTIYFNIIVTIWQPYLRNLNAQCY